jgi:acyl carrier protein
MTRDETLALVAEILGDIAPEADLSTVPGDADLREALDLDSMDILNFVAALHERTARAIPESDTSRLLTLEGLVAFFEAAS